MNAYRPGFKPPAALVLLGALAFGPVLAAEPASDGALECRKVVRAGSRIPEKVCGEAPDPHRELTYPLPGVTPADRVRRLDEPFPWLTIDTGSSGQRR